MFSSKKLFSALLCLAVYTSPLTAMRGRGAARDDNGGTIDALLRTLGPDGVRKWVDLQDRDLTPEQCEVLRAAEEARQAQYQTERATRTAQEATRQTQSQTERATRQAQAATRQAQYRAEQEQYRAEAANAQANAERARRERVREEDQNRQREHARQVQREGVRHQHGLAEQREKARLEKSNQDATAQYADRLTRQREADLRQERAREQQERTAREARAHKERLDRETEAAKAKAEAEARAQAEKEKEMFEHRQGNKDAYREWEQEQHARKKDEIKTRIQALKDAFFEFCDDPIRMKKVLFTAGSAAILSASGIYFFKHFWPIVRKKVEEKLFVPALIDETSFGSKSFFGFWKKKKPVGPQLNELVYYPELGKHVECIKHVLTNTRKHGGYYLNYLFYGEPGTGKTATARALARESGMDWAFMSGGNVQKLLKTGKAEERLKEVFSWAQKSKNGLILFIDEADAFLKDPNQSELSEELYAVLNSFLNMTGTESQKICFILSTNHPNKLSKAVRDRVGPGQMIHFGLPPEEQRKLIAQHFVHKYIAKNKKIELNDLEDYIIESIAPKTEGFSGRGLSQLVLSIEKAALTKPDPMLTKQLIDDVVDYTVKQHGLEQNFSSYA